MIDQLLDGMVIGMTMTARMTWWVFPAVEIFDKLKDAVHDILSGGNTKNTEEQSI